MTKLDFSFGNAVFHFLRMGDSRGFLLRFTLVYGLIALVISVISTALQWPLYEIYLRMFTEGDGDFAGYTDEINAASLNANLVSLVLMPVALGVWVIFEAASQRRFMRGDGFGLRLGADEGRIAVVGLIWIALLIAAYIGFAILVAIVAGLAFAFGGAGVGIAMLVLVMLAGFGAFLWLFARLSPAGALTIRDQQIRFFEAWRVTKGRTWTLFLAYLMLFLIAAVIVLVFYGLLGGLAFVQLLPVLEEGVTPTPAQFVGVITQPAFWGPAVLIFLLMSLFNGLFVHALGGPAALAAKHDPDWLGPDSVPEVFT